MTPDGDGADLTPSIYAKKIGSPEFNGTYAQVPLSSTVKATAVSGNYIIFTGMTANDVTIRGRQESGTRAPINAFQIVKIPSQGTVFVLK